MCAKTLIHIYSFLLLPFYFSLIYAQAPDTLWTKTYGGIDSDGGYAVQQTLDSGYIVVGWTLSSGTGNYDIYMIKTDSLGDTLWTKAHDGLGDEVGRSVQQTTDGGYIIAGDSYIGGYDIYLMKTDSLGDTLWTKRYGGADSEKAYSVQQTTDNGFIIAGYVGASTYDVYLMKTDSLGDTLWTKTYGGAQMDEARSVDQCVDGGYFIVGTTWSFPSGGYNDVWILKTDSLGDTLWTKVYGYSGDSDEWGYSGCQTTDKGYIIVGTMGDFYLIKTDSLGDSLWTRTYGGSLGDDGYSVYQTTDCGYIIGGVTKISASNEAVYLVRTDSLGDTLWTRTYGGADLDRAYAVQQTLDGGYIVAGRTLSFGAGSADVWLLRLESESCIEEQKIFQNTAFLEINPNPFYHKTQIKFQIPKIKSQIELKIYDATGHLVRDFDLMTTGISEQITWTGEDNSGVKLTSGVYFLQFKSENCVTTRKLILLR